MTDRDEERAQDDAPNVLDRGDGWGSCADCGGDREVSLLTEDGLCETCYQHRRIRSMQAAAARAVEARHIAARLRIPVEAIKLNEANPGVTIRTKSVLSPWYYDDKIALPAGTTLTIDGWHMPNDDEYFGYEALDYPAGADATPVQNLRIRTKDERGHEILLALQDLQAFDAVQPVEEDLRQQNMPGESVFDLPPRQLGPEGPSQVPQPSPESTAAERPPKGPPPLQRRPPAVLGPDMSTEDLVSPTQVSQRPQPAA